MSDFDILYLSIVLVAFLGFAGVLAYVSHRDRLPKEPPSQSFPRSPFTNLPPI
jgi:hypothetical protein